MRNTLDTQDTKCKIGAFHSALRMVMECMKPSKKKLLFVSEFSCSSQSHSALALSCLKQCALVTKSANGLLDSIRRRGR